jgi:hypothetical protein
MQGEGKELRTPRSPTHHHLIHLEGALVADPCLGDHNSRAMSLVRLPHANVSLPPGVKR